MATYGPPLDFSGVIPIEFSTQIIEEALRQSTVLQLANIMPMGTSIVDMPVPASLPTAGWVSVAGGRKPYAALGLTEKQIKAEEVAATTAIPDVYLEDSSINLWGWVRPRIAEAIALALDNAVMFGVGAPASFPAGGMIAPAFCQAVGGTPIDAVDAVNQAMGLVEQQGLNVTGHAADLIIKSVLRGQRANTNELLLGENQVASRTVPTLYGEPISYSSWSTIATSDFITGDWNALILGVRQDIRYNIDPSGVIADDTGKVIISGWQDNVTPMKVWARFGCCIINPVTTRVPAGGKPFGMSKLSTYGFTRSAQAASADDEPKSGGRK